MQLMPETARYIADARKIPFRIEDLANPAVNIHLGVAYLDHLRRYYNGDFTKILVAYNMGPARLDEIIRANRFELNQSRAYVEGIRRGASYWRVYGLGAPRAKNVLSEVREWLRDRGV